MKCPYRTITKKFDEDGMIYITTEFPECLKNMCPAYKTRALGIATLLESCARTQIDETPNRKG